MVDEENQGVAVVVAAQTPADLIPTTHPLRRRDTAVVGTPEETAVTCKDLTN
jgi:hypothetical protein